MKKILSTILALSLLFSCSISAFAANVSSFTDVHQGDWFYNSVSFVTQKGLFEGTAADSFSPNGTMTRGMFVTVLGRYGGASVVVSDGEIGRLTKNDVNVRSTPSTSGSIVASALKIGTTVEILGTAPDTEDPAYTWFQIKYKGIVGYIRSDLMEKVENLFTDVPEAAYYSPYVRWACDAGIAAPTGSGTFSPERNITREEICSMLFNYAAFKNLRLKPTVPAAAFSDSGSISREYAASVSMLQQTGVINGYGDGLFKPQGSATRAEVSSMLMRFIDAVSYKPVMLPPYDANGNYIFGADVQQNVQLGADYFNDACFIGHSLVEGMKASFSLPNTDFFSFNGATARTILSNSGFKIPIAAPDEAGKPATGTLDQALSSKSYAKVYIMLGINELGPETGHQNAFKNNIYAVLDIVRKTQPNAKIYIISMSPVSKSCSETSKNFNRDNALIYNDILRQLCRDKGAYFINIFDLLAGDDGYLPTYACMSDGIHLLASQYVKIKTHLLTHTI
ncbi:MAG: S-layer homology domain-containing protein [Oscillospiraceae bacterium]